MQIKCGTKWTQLPLTFCSGQKTEQKPVSPAHLNDAHAGPLADFTCDIDSKTTADSLWSWRLKHSKRIKSNLTAAQQSEIEQYYQKKMEALNGKVQEMRKIV